MAQIPVRNCGFCKKAVSFLYCTECKQGLCIECRRDVHDKVPSCKDHEVVNNHSDGNRVYRAHPECETHNSTFLYHCCKCDCLTCKECMTDNHNEHKIEKIKKVADTSRKNVNNIIEKLKTKVDIVKTKLETIQTEQFSLIKSDFDAYVTTVEETADDLCKIVNQYKLIHKTAASDFKDIESEDLYRKKVFFEKRHDETVDRLLKFENLLHETHDSTFLTQLKALEMDIEIINKETDDQLSSPRCIDSFNPYNFTKLVIDEIDEKFQMSLKKKETRANELHKENSMLIDEIRLKQEEIIHLSNRCNAISIVLVGTKGSGKSSTGNCILGENKFGNYMETKDWLNQIQMEKIKNTDAKVLVIDTPGVHDLSDFNENMKILKLQDNAVYGIVVSIGKFTSLDRRLLKNIEENNGYILKKTFIVFTRKNELNMFGNSKDGTIDQWLKNVPWLSNFIGRHKLEFCIFENVNADSKTKVAQVKDVIDLCREIVHVSV